MKVATTFRYMSDFPHFNSCICQTYGNLKAIIVFRIWKGGAQEAPATIYWWFMFIVRSSADADTDKTHKKDNSPLWVCKPTPCRCKKNKKHGSKTPLTTRHRTHTHQNPYSSFLWVKLDVGSEGGLSNNRSTSHRTHWNQIWHIIYYSVHHIQNKIISLEPMPTEWEIPVGSLC